MENTVTVQPTALKPSLVKTTEFELERYWLTRWLKCGSVENPQIFMLKAEHFTLCIKDNDTTKLANIKIVVLIFTRTRTIAKFYLKCKIVRTCDFFHYLMTINLETFQRK